MEVSGGIVARTGTAGTSTSCHVDGGWHWWVAVGGWSVAARGVNGLSRSYSSPLFDVSMRRGIVNRNEASVWRNNLLS